ncbi:SNAP25 homologous protein SNAP29 [Selaginella moellendorffii]|uniref:SNAP25 homologous protein SNAP29 n=1 Tax=Selaginella moellendorffii TaxID=88036 RepID=UPI000D1CA182|nr:SNAP25 homologous protein SNAP29 [Selaginella moellendorffii]|eukprot:XP_024528056.1 SNAP25 homologous protein SNAP29 [Selaginella moellendorffii]
MVQRRASRGGMAPLSARNPFDSEEEPSPPPASAPYRNPFDGDEIEQQQRPRKVTFKSSEKSNEEPRKSKEEPKSNPFDDEGMWNKRHENSRRPAATAASTASPSPPKEHGGSDGATTKHSDEAKQRRRDRVKEKLSTMSDDVGNLVKPRSRNLMGGNNNHNRQLLFEEDGSTSAVIQNEQRKFTQARIERGIKAGDSLEGESVQELEDYAVQKAEETTVATYKALKLAEEIKESATNTSVMLHEQGHQITRTHETAVDIDHALSRGEKLLGSLGGLFSKTWKPKKARNITGPMLSRGDSFKRKAYGMEQRAALGLNRSNSKGKTRHTAAVADSSGSQAQTRITNEFAKQDEALSDLSNVLGQLKEMTIDMGSEIGRQTDALGHLEDDVGELGSRVRGANERGRRLLGR